MWIWILLSFFFGAMFGVILMSVLCANNANMYRRRDDEQRSNG